MPYPCIRVGACHTDLASSLAVSLAHIRRWKTFSRAEVSIWSAEGCSRPLRRNRLPDGTDRSGKCRATPSSKPAWSGTVTSGFHSGKHGCRGQPLGRRTEQQHFLGRPARIPNDTVPARVPAEQLADAVGARSLNELVTAVQSGWTRQRPSRPLTGSWLRTATRCPDYDELFCRQRRVSYRVTGDFPRSHNVIAGRHCCSLRHQTETIVNTSDGVVVSEESDGAKSAKSFSNDLTGTVMGAEANGRFQLDEFMETITAELPSKQASRRALNLSFPGATVCAWMATGSMG